MTAHDEIRDAAVRVGLSACFGGFKTDPGLLNTHQRAIYEAIASHAINETARRCAELVSCGWFGPDDKCEDNGIEGRCLSCRQREAIRALFPSAFEEQP